MVGYAEYLDAQISTVLSSWNIYTTALAIIVGATVLYPILFSRDPDIHPFLLSRQARVSPVRSQNESALYRCLEVPHGYPLKAGLDIKDNAEPKWKPGRNGTLLDIWQCVKDGDADGRKGKIISSFGTDDTSEHDIDEITGEINIMGQYLVRDSLTRVAICLPNTIELLTALFACVLHGITPVMVPFGQPQIAILDVLKKTKTDCVITSAGSIDLSGLTEAAPSLRKVLWVVARNSKHMDWNGIPDDLQERLSVAVWGDILQEHEQDASAAMPSASNTELVNVGIVSRPQIDAPYVVTEYSQANLVAGTAGLLSALPSRERLSGSDIVLAADSFCDSYVICHVLGALFTHATLIISSVAGPQADLSHVFQSNSPTVLITSDTSVARLHKSIMAAPRSLAGLLKLLVRRHVLGNGNMFANTVVAELIGDAGIPQPSKRLRLIHTAHSVENKGQLMQTAMLNDIRACTNAHICHALKAAGVAGAITQSNIYDYRADLHHKRAHLGVPVPSTEILLQNEDDNEVSSTRPRGNLVVLGPAVVGKSAKLDLKVTIQDDYTLIL